MALTDYKISSADLVNKGVVGLPDTPALNTTQMQEKFDEIATDVIIPKYNGLVDAIIAIDPAGKMEAENPTGTGTFSMNPVEEAHLGDCSTTLGDSCEASGEQSLAGGYHSTTEHDVAFVYGDHVESTSDNCAVFGSYNAAVEGDLFEIGDGSYGSPSNAFGVHSNGDVYAKGTFTDGSGNVLSDMPNKANSSEVYKKTEVDTALTAKANISNPTFTGSFSHNGSSLYPLSSKGVVMGDGCRATGQVGVAIGSHCSASGTFAFATGAGTVAHGSCSSAFGNGTFANGNNQSVRGKFNTLDDSNKYADIVGGGTNDGEADRANIETLDWDGNFWVAGNVEAAGEITDGNGITLSELLPTDTESGNPCVITDAFGGKAKSLSLDIEPIQDLHGYDKPWIGGAGKNKYSIKVGNDAWYTNGGASKSVGANGELIVSCVNSSAVSGVYVANGSTYKTVANGFGTAYYVSLDVVANASATVKIGNTGVPTSVNVSTTKQRVKISFSSYADFVIYGNSNNITLTISNFMLSTENTDTYEPYENICPISGISSGTVTNETSSQTITRTYGQTVYGGGDDVTGSGATVTKAIYSLTDSNISNWTYWSQAAGTIYIGASGLGAKLNTSPISNYYASATNPANHDDMTVGVDGFNLYLRNSNLTSISDWETWLAGKTVDIVYELTTPTTISLASQNIDLLHGDNVIVSNAKTVNVSYKADVQLYIDKKLSE